MNRNGEIEYRNKHQSDNVFLGEEQSDYNIALWRKKGH